MHFTNAIVLASAAVASAKQTIRIDVGKDGLTYTPAGVQAAVGDDIEFHFFPKNHTVTQSSFAKPCVPLANSFFSGFVPTPPAVAGQSTFTITVQDTKPIWFYCGQADHCKKGMVGSVNAPSVGNTLDAFTALAMKTNSTSNPPVGPIGGTLQLAGSNTTTTTTTTAATTGTSSDCSGVAASTQATTVAAGTGTQAATVSATKPATTVPVSSAGKLGAGIMAIVAAVAML